jgi:HSP20 family protein
MFGHWNDMERTLAAVDDLRRQMERALWDDEPQTDGPRVSLWDAGQQLVLKADVSGMGEKDVSVQMTRDVLTIHGRRERDLPEGYSVHRQERMPVRFSRGFTMPCKVDADRIVASLKDGVLTVTLPKAPESQPRQIAVKAV